MGTCWFRRMGKSLRCKAAKVRFSIRVCQGHSPHLILSHTSLWGAGQGGNTAEIKSDCVLFQ